jgi:hypothetical protein
MNHLEPENLTEQPEMGDQQPSTISEKDRGDTTAFDQPMTDFAKPERVSKGCQLHGASQTPLLDTHLREPRIKASLQALSSLLADAVEGGTCLECVTEAAAHTLTSCLRDFQMAVKSGQLSRKEKKALKAEAKGLAKDMKHNIHHAWHAGRSDSSRHIGRGIWLRK